MAAFIYRAVDSAGRPKRGVIEAGNAASARESLRRQDLLPLSVEATAAPSTEAASSRLTLPNFARPALVVRSLALVTRQLSTLVDSDVRIEDALRTVAQQTTSPRMASLLLNVRSGILDGRSFSNSLGDHPRAFPEFYRASVAAGEQSSRLGPVLSRLADFIEARERNRQKIQLALIYPTLLAIVSLGIVTLLLTYVVPDIARAFTSRGAELPLLTRGLIAISAGINAYGWVIALGVIAAVLLARQWLSHAKNRVAVHRLLTTNPMTATLSRQVNAAQFAGTLATLVQSDVPLLDALHAAGKVMPNLYIRTKVALIATRVREGSSLRGAVTEAACFPPMLVAMVSSGEGSGNLGSALERAAADQQRELDAWIATLLAMVEPGILLLMGGIVLLMVLSILLPIVHLNDLAGIRR